MLHLRTRTCLSLASVNQQVRDLAKHLSATHTLTHKLPHHTHSLPPSHTHTQPPSTIQTHTLTHNTYKLLSHTLDFNTTHKLSLSHTHNFSSCPHTVTRSWHSQDTCALSRHYEPVQASSWSRLGTHRRTDQDSQLMGVGTRSPTWTLSWLTSHGQWICTPENCRFPS